MYIEENNGLKLLRFDSFTDKQPGGAASDGKGLPGVSCAVSTRTGGVSPEPFGGLNLGAWNGDSLENVGKNLDLFCSALGAAPDKLAAMRQNHTANVFVVEEGSVLPAENTDALVTAAAGVPLLALSADCALTVFYDSRRRALAVIHSGWKGGLLNIYSSVLNIMRLRFGTVPENIVAGVSPMISADHCPVREDFLEKLQAFYPGLEGRKFLTLREGRHHFSLRELLKYQLTALGVKKYEFMHLCTYAEKELFYSRRRDGESTGRFGLMAMLKEGYRG
ncbi:MAG TPA: hypothetical protein DCL44_08085 [Elusimicrobia bacterium]|nr:hypothetical protein [Elusimicrobiota bacterium]